MGLFKYIKNSIKKVYDKYETKEFQFVATIFSIISTIVMTYLTIIMSIANDRMAEANDRMAASNDRMSISGDNTFILARYQHTTALCNRFNETYNDTKNLDRYEYKIWEENNIDYEIDSVVRQHSPTRNTTHNRYQSVKDFWTVRDSTKMDEAFVDRRIHRLMNNSFLNQILQYCEEAKILHQKKLLDVDAFENDFAGTFYRLKHAEYPTITEYIDHVRKMSKRTDKEQIWDGYYYCIDNIISQFYQIGDSGKITRINVTEGDSVRKGDVLLSYKVASTGESKDLKSYHNGRIEKIYVNKRDINTTVFNKNKIVFRISQKDYF